MKQIETKGVPQLKQIITYSDILGEVQFQPRHSMIFIPETLGISLWSYVEFFEDDKEEVWHIVMTSNPSQNAKRVAPNKRAKLQARLRKKGLAMASFNFPELREYLNMPEKKFITKTSPLNCTHIFNAAMATYHTLVNCQWLPETRRGVAINLETIRTIDKEVVEIDEEVVEIE
jgi:hypothetical protein